MDQTFKSMEKTVRENAERMQAVLEDTSGSAAAVPKSNVYRSGATRDAASKLRSEVVKRPLTYTIAAAAVGALIGLGIFTLMNRPRH